MVNPRYKRAGQVTLLVHVLHSPALTGGASLFIGGLMAIPIRQLLSQTSYNADGATTVWNFSFAGGYLDQAHVKAYYTAAALVRTEVAMSPSMFVGPFQLSIVPAVPPATVVVRVPLIIWFRYTINIAPPPPAPPPPAPVEVPPVVEAPVDNTVENVPAPVDLPPIPVEAVQDQPVVTPDATSTPVEPTA